MNNVHDLLELAEALIHKKTGIYCSELQRRILLAALDAQGERKTYDQLAAQCGYSTNYVSQDVAPKLWRLLTQILGAKTKKSNVGSLLRSRMNAPPAPESAATPPKPSPLTKLPTPVPASTPTAAPDPIPVIAATLNGAAANAVTNILLVDDQPKNLRLLSDLLDEQGYEVQQAINGEVAIQSAKLSLPDLILLDIHMPDMDGYTVCQQLKADPATQDIPVIFVSALDEAWDKVKAFSVGGADYIAKPFRVVEVLARVKNQLKRRQLQRALADQNRQLQRAVQELKRLVAIDEFTQVASRRRLDQYLLTRWHHAIKTQTPLTLMLCQIDGFNFGHDLHDAQVSDQALYHIAQHIQMLTQGTHDLVGRYGTVIFAIILPDMNEPAGQAFANTLLTQVAKLKLPSLKTGVTLGIGASTKLPDPNLGLENLLEECDRNLQQATEKGGNCIVYS